MTEELSEIQQAHISFIDNADIPTSPLKLSPNDESEQLRDYMCFMTNSMKSDYDKLMEKRSSTCENGVQCPHCHRDFSRKQAKQFNEHVGFVLNGRYAFCKTRALDIENAYQIMYGVLPENTRIYFSGNIGNDNSLITRSKWVLMNEDIYNLYKNSMITVYSSGYVFYNYKNPDTDKDIAFHRIVKRREFNNVDDLNGKEVHHIGSRRNVNTRECLKIVSIMENRQSDKVANGKTLVGFISQKRNKFVVELCKNGYLYIKSFEDYDSAVQMHQTVFQEIYKETDDTIIREKLNENEITRKVSTKHSDRQRG